MKRILLFFAFFLFSNFLSAQLSEVWRQYDSIPFPRGAEAFGAAVEDDHNGLFISTGVNGDEYIFHYNSSSQLQWKQRLNSNGLGSDGGVGIERGPSGLIYVAGSVTDMATGRDVFMACLDTSGNILWEKTWNGSWNGDDDPNDMKILPNGNIAVVGSSQTNFNTTNCLLLIWSPAGILLAHQELSSFSSNTNNTNRYDALTVLPNGNIVACGQMCDTITGKDGIITCFDPLGNSIAWNTTWSTTTAPGVENLYAILSDSSGVFVGGSAGNDSRGNILHYSTSGALQWSYQAPISFNASCVIDMAFDPAGNICAAVRGTVTDFKAMKLSHSGSLLWSYTYIPTPYNGHDSPYQIQTDQNGNIYINGFIAPCLSCKDQAVLKLTPGGTFGWIRFRNGSETSSDDYATHLLVSGNKVFSFGRENNALVGDDATYSVYDTSGATVSLVTYDQPAGMLNFTKMTTDAAGNIYVAGIVGNVFVVTKRDFQGNLLWETLYPDSMPNIITLSIKTDPAGNVYVGGTEEHTLTNQDIILLKFNSAGQFQWAKNYSGPGNYNDYLGCVYPDSYGNIYVTGNITYTPGIGDAVVLKYDSNGNLIWNDFFNGTAMGPDLCGQIISDGNNTLLFTYSAFNAGNNYDLALVKMDTAGNVIWQSMWSNPTNYSAYGTFVGKFTGNGIVVVGESSWLTYGLDIEVVKFDTLGNFVWHNTLNNGVPNGTDRPYDFAMKGDTVYLAGSEGTPPSSQDYNYYCAAIDSSGTLVWENLIIPADSSNSRAYGITVDPVTGIIAATGFTNYEHDIVTYLFSPSGSIIDSAFIAGPNEADGLFIANHNGSFIVSGKIQYDGDDYGIGITVRYCNGPMVQAANDIVICTGDTVQLSATPGFISYQWTPSSTLSNAAINNPSAWPSSTTTYSLVAINNNGCESYADQKIIVGGIPSLSVTSSSTSICSGDTLPIQLNGVTSCLWQPSNYLAGNSLLSNYAWPPVSQNYFITGYNQWGCTDTASIYVTVIPGPVVTITTLLPDSMCITDAPITLNGSPIGGVFTGNGISGTSFDPALAGIGISNFYYTYIDITSGCSAYFPATIYIDSCTIQSTIDYASENLWSVYPVPANTEINIIRRGFSGEFNLKLIDAASRTVIEKRVMKQENVLNLNVEHIENGIYYIVIDNGSERSVQKVLIQH